MLKLWLKQGHSVLKLVRKAFSILDNTDISVSALLEILFSVIGMR